MMVPNPMKIHDLVVYKPILGNTHIMLNVIVTSSQSSPQPNVPPPKKLRPYDQGL